MSDNPGPISPDGAEWVDVPDPIWGFAVESGANIRVDNGYGADVSEPAITGEE